jgi:LPXTG-motif cell wall-anchored protein
MRGKQDGQHTGRLLARGGVALLAAASIGFAAPAVAAQPDTPSAGHQDGSTSSTSTPTGSAVSLDRPNSFQAQADPDGTANGGVDQPGGTGGVDTTSQDGNNGSGNDADCEDDNRGVGVPGHCKVRPTDAPEVATATPTDRSTETAVTKVATLSGTDGTLVSAPARGLGQAAAVSSPTGVLPNTGAGQALLGLAIAGVASLAAGAGILRRSRRTARVGS